MARKVYFEKTEESKRIVAVKRGRLLVTNAVFSDTSDNDLVSELLQHMRDNDVKTVVMSNQLICREQLLGWLLWKAKRTRSMTTNTE